MIAHHPRESRVATMQLDAVRELLDALFQDLECIDPVARHDANFGQGEHGGCGVRCREQRQERGLCLLETAEGGEARSERHPETAARLLDLVHGTECM